MTVVRRVELKISGLEICVLEICVLEIRLEVKYGK